MQDFVKSSNYPVLVISYEMFVRVYEDLTPVTFDLVICDEGHRLKNTAIKTTSVSETIPTQNIQIMFDDNCKIRFNKTTVWVNLSSQNLYMN